MGFKDLVENREGEFPPEGWEGTVICVDANYRQTKNGFPSYGLLLQVVGGEDNEKTFFDNVYFSGNARFNDQSFVKLEAAGVEADYWKTDPDEENAVPNKLVGLKFNLRATWDPNEDDASRPWLRCTYYPIDGAAAPVGSEPEGF